MLHTGSNSLDKIGVIFSCHIFLNNGLGWVLHTGSSSLDKMGSLYRDEDGQNTRPGLCHSGQMHGRAAPGQLVQCWPWFTRQSLTPECCDHLCVCDVCNSVVWYWLS